MTEENKPWFNSWPENMPKSIKHCILLQDILEITAKQYPEKASIDFFNRALTFRDLNLFSGDFASALASVGISKGDVVAISRALVAGSDCQFSACNFN